MLKIYDLSSPLDNQDKLQELYKQHFNITDNTFNFDKFQLIAFREIDLDNNVLVSAPTSSGKTSVAEYALIRAVQNKKKVIYTSPIKSLSNEKYKEFKDRNICSVGLLTGDNKINVDADCVVMTAEILRNSLYKEKELDIGCVIMDEVHFINDVDRGKIWEETIIMLPQHIQIIMLSATINRVEHFASWINNIRDKSLSLIKSNRRIVPLNYYIYTNELYKILDNNDVFNDLSYFNSKKSYEKIKEERKLAHKSDYDPSYFDKIVKYLIKNDLLQTIFFSFSRLNCEKYATSISNILEAEESANAVNMFDHLMRKYRTEYESIPQYVQIRELVQKGVCYHHSGLIPIIKEVIEILFRNGFIKVLFATETFAVGVNMPTRTVIFTELTKPNGPIKRFLNTAEFKQMSGRAGRRGKDIIGHVILLPYYGFPDLSDLKSVMLKSMPSIESKFQLDYYYCLKTINMQQNIYEKSLLNNEQSIMVSDTNIRLQELYNKKNNYTFSQQDIESYDKQYKLSSPSGSSIDFGFMKLSKSQIKELKKLEQTNNQIEYKKYLEYKKIINDIEYLEKTAVNIRLYGEKMNNIIKNILVNEKYLLDNNKLDIYGLAVINCNECNGIILTELLRNGILDNMNGDNIITLMSIFASYGGNIDSNNLKLEYNYILDVINKWTDYETQYQLSFGEEYWETTNGYFDIVSEWISLDINKDLHIIMSHLKEMEEYEGNFVRNMLKIYNICVTLKSMCELVNKYDIVLKLVDIDKKILKSIVNVNSLYLN